MATPPANGSQDTIRPEAEDEADRIEDTVTGTEDADVIAPDPETDDTPETPLAVDAETEGTGDIMDAEVIDDLDETGAEEATDSAPPSDAEADAAAEGEDRAPDEDAPVADPEPADGSTEEEAAAGSGEPPAAPAPAPEAQPSRGPGVIALVIGGIVAVGIGYGASLLGILPGTGGRQSAELEDMLARQTEALGALQAQVSALAEVEPPAPEIDLSPLADQITGLTQQIEATASTIETLADRVSTLEARPLFSGEIESDLAAAAETVTALEEEVRAREEENARLAAEAEAAEAAAREAAAQAAAEAEAAIAEAEAEAEATMAAAEARAALGQLRIAIATGEPFAEALAGLSGAMDVPEPLMASAETGVPTVETLQDSFPPAAREALPAALLETAGDGAVERLTAFLQGQVGGRSVEPRDGDDPDAILSRAQAAVDAADFTTALAEVATLPEGARAAMAGWVAQAETRTAVDEALDTIAAALDGAN